MNQIKENNIKQGAAAEKRLLKKLQEKFNDRHLYKSCNTFDPFDFYGMKTVIELKSRNVCKDDFPTTMIGMNKIEMCETLYELQGKKIYFVFEFIDGLYYWRYNKEKVKQYSVEFSGTMKRGKDERKNHLMIPIEDLKMIEEY